MLKSWSVFHIFCTNSCIFVNLEYLIFLILTKLF
nr:MAG TPA: hypothetical protein [Caudoviricetes sp.]